MPRIVELAPVRVRPVDPQALALIRRASFIQGPAPVLLSRRTLIRAVTLASAGLALGPIACGGKSAGAILLEAIKALKDLFPVVEKITGQISLLHDNRFKVTVDAVVQLLGGLTGSASERAPTGRVTALENGLATATLEDNKTYSIDVDPSDTPLQSDFVFGSEKGLQATTVGAHILRATIASQTAQSDQFVVSQ